MMKKRFGAIILGVAIVLAGCGGGQTDETSGAWSAATGISGTEVNAQTEPEQSGKEREWPLGKVHPGKCDIRNAAGYQVWGFRFNGHTVHELAAWGRLGGKGVAL